MGEFNLQKFISKAKCIIIFIVIELCFYFKIQPDNLELFLMIWNSLYLGLLLLNIFNIKSDVGLIKLKEEDKVVYANLAGSLIEIESETKKNNQQIYEGLLDYMNLVYIFLIIINSIGYIFVMPK